MTDNFMLMLFEDLWGEDDEDKTMIELPDKELSSPKDMEKEEESEKNER